MKKIIIISFLFAVALIGNAHTDTGNIYNNNPMRGDILDADVCPDSSIFSQPPRNCGWGWSLTASDEDHSDSIFLYDDYLVYTPICGIHFWGCDLEEQWMGDPIECAENPMTFNIEFCPEEGSGMPDTANPAYSYIITVEHDPNSVCVLDNWPYDTYYLWEWHVQLDPCCTLQEGWLGIQGVGNGQDCLFYWYDTHHSVAYGYDSWRSNGNYTGHSQAFCLIGDPSTPCLTCSTTCLTPRVPNDNGTIIWDLTVTNRGIITISPVIGEIVPTNIDCSGTQYDFNLTKQLVTSLDPGLSYQRQYFYRPGIVDDAFADVALTIYVGTAINDYLSSCCFEFMFADAWGRGNASSWGTQGEWGEYNGGVLPVSTTLGNNYPNPFNASTTIPFEISQSGNVSLSIYNIAGQLVETLYDGQMAAGSHTVVWEASAVASGVYFYKLTVDNHSATKRMELLK